MGSIRNRIVQGKKFEQNIEIIFYLLCSFGILRILIVIKFHSRSVDSRNNVSMQKAQDQKISYVKLQLGFSGFLMPVLVS